MNEDMEIWVRHARSLGMTKCGIKIAEDLLAEVERLRARLMKAEQILEANGLGRLVVREQEMMAALDGGDDVDLSDPGPRGYEKMRKPNEGGDQT